MLTDRVATPIGEPDAIAMVFFFARRTQTAEHFYAAGRSITAAKNGFAELFAAMQRQLHFGGDRTRRSVGRGEQTRRAATPSRSGLNRHGRCSSLPAQFDDRDRRSRLQRSPHAPRRSLTTAVSHIRSGSNVHPS